MNGDIAQYSMESMYDGPEPGEQINWAKIEHERYQNELINERNKFQRVVNGKLYRMCLGSDYHLVYAKGDLVNFDDGKGWVPCPDVLLMEDLKPSECLLRPEENMNPNCSRA